MAEERLGTASKLVLGLCGAAIIGGFAMMGKAQDLYHQYQKACPGISKEAQFYGDENAARAIIYTIGIAGLGMGLGEAVRKRD
jgi:hypothetical protein